MKLTVTDTAKEKFAEVIANSTEKGETINYIRVYVAGVG